jgi:uncharacterized protein YndB with AHSA1/START domain
MNGLVAKSSITINAPISEVWDAIVNPETIKKYFFGTTVVSDWKNGSTITYKGEWEGKPYEDPGKIINIEKEKILEFDHRSGKDADIPENYHRVIFEVKPAESGTNVTITQDNNKTEDDQKHSAELWNMVLESMKKLLEQ